MFNRLRLEKFYRMSFNIKVVESPQAKQVANAKKNKQTHKHDYKCRR